MTKPCIPCGQFGEDSESFTPTVIDIPKGTTITWTDHATFVGSQQVIPFNQPYGFMGSFEAPRDFKGATVGAKATIAGFYITVRDSKGEESHPLED